MTIDGHKLAIKSQEALDKYLDRNAASMLVDADGVGFLEVEYLTHGGVYTALRPSLTASPIETCQSFSSARQK